MKHFLFPFLFAFVGFALVSNLRSQQFQAAKSPLQTLQQIKAANDAQIKKQTEMMTKLDELQKEAAQIKFLGKRG